MILIGQLTLIRYRPALVWMAWMHPYMYPNTVLGFLSYTGVIFGTVKSYCISLHKNRPFSNPLDISSFSMCLDTVSTFHASFA